MIEDLEEPNRHKHFNSESGMLFYAGELCYLAGSQTGIDTVEISEAEPVDIYDLSGVKVYSGLLDNVSLGKGIYIIRQGNVTRKVAIDNNLRKIVSNN